MSANSGVANELVGGLRSRGERIGHVEAHDLGEYFRGPCTEQHLEQHRVRRFLAWRREYTSRFVALGVRAVRFVAALASVPRVVAESRVPA